MKLENNKSYKKRYQEIHDTEKEKIEERTVYAKKPQRKKGLVQKKSTLFSRASRERKHYKTK